MEKKLCIKNYTGGSVTAVTYLPTKREVVVGYEEGLMRCWELETGKPTSSNHKHRGWVSQLYYWAEAKVLFSASVDSTIVQWSPSFEPYYTIELAGPIYCLVWSSRRDVLVCGRKGCIGLVNLSGKMSSNGLPLLSRREVRIEGHSDMVKCLAVFGNKAYSAGLDRKLFVYEISTLPGSLPLRPLTVKHNAHDAGITCMLVTKDADGSSWLATGSYDQKVKIWTSEGKFMLEVPCPNAVTGLCYVFPAKVLWVAAGLPLPIFLEPKLGANITPFVPVLGESPTEKSKAVQSISYFPEIAEVLGFNNRKEVLSWKYAASCSICIQEAPSSGHIETITYTSKFPILLFTGSYDGMATKWERHQLNTFVYIAEKLQYRDKLISHVYSEESEWNMLEVVGKEMELENGLNKDTLMSEDVKARYRQELLKEDYRGFVRSVYAESLDYLIMSCLDGRIMVWGYDRSNVGVLIQMLKLNSGPESIGSVGDVVCNEDATGRVAGLSCLKVLNGHSSAVSGLVLVPRDGRIYLVSVSWDCYVCVWNITEQMNLISRVKHNSEFVAGETIIMDADYSPKSDMIAYSTSDCTVFLCPFTCKRAGLRPKMTLTGHTGEVTQVRWNKFIDKWVTGSEDGTVKLWPADGKGGYEMTVKTGGPVTVLIIDKTHGLIIAAIGNVIKLYNSELEVVQVSHGHTDSIQSIIHVPELQLYFSAGWDKNLRIWRAYHPRPSTAAF